VYEFENKNLPEENQKTLKALGLAFMHSRNPKESDDERKIREIFTKEHGHNE